MVAKLNAIAAEAMVDEWHQHPAESIADDVSSHTLSPIGNSGRLGTLRVYHFGDVQKRYRYSCDNHDAIDSTRS